MRHPLAVIASLRSKPQHICWIISARRHFDRREKSAQKSRYRSGLAKRFLPSVEMTPCAGKKGKRFVVETWHAASLLRLFCQEKNEVKMRLYAIAYAPPACRHCELAKQSRRSNGASGIVGVHSPAIRRGAPMCAPLTAIGQHRCFSLILHTLTLYVLPGARVKGVPRIKFLLRAKDRGWLPSAGCAAACLRL
jgi:hypothetical protein